MEEKFVEKIIDLVFQANKLSAAEKESLSKQRAHIKIEGTDHKVNNKYFSFSLRNGVDEISPVKVTHLSVLFEELNQGFLVECILFFVNGFMNSLEVYTPNGGLFETIDIENIRINSPTHKNPHTGNVPQ